MVISVLQDTRDARAGCNPVDGGKVLRLKRSRRLDAVADAHINNYTWKMEAAFILHSETDL